MKVFHRCIWIIVAAFPIGLEMGRLFAQTATPQVQAPVTVLQIPNAPIPMRVLAQGPADTVTELQIICLFRSDSANSLHGSLVEIDEKLKHLLSRIRKPELFRGELGETLLITPPAGGIAAKRLLIVGLGDSQTFTPERLELVGAIVYREANRLHVEHPFFAPTVLDGGVNKFATAQLSEPVVRGFLRAADTEKAIQEITGNSSMSVQDLTFLAGTTHAASTQEGINKAVAAHAK